MIRLGGLLERSARGGRHIRDNLLLNDGFFALFFSVEDHLRRYKALYSFDISELTIIRMPRKNFYEKIIRWRRLRVDERHLTDF